MSVLDYYDLDANGDVPVCIHCGQCAAACPFDSMHAKSELEKVKAALADPEKIVVIQTAPAVRVAIGEGFGYEPGTFLEGKMVGALRALGADYVVDTNFGADLTIMEEASELVERLKNGGQIPQFTSCCPAWVRFAEIYFPELIPNLSSTRSCIAMEAAMIKTYFAEKKGINPSNIVSVSVAVVHGGKNTRDFLNALKDSDKHYDFIEVMACPGGCIGGGGQPRTKLPQAVKTKEARIGGLYEADANYKWVASYENPEIQALYKDFLGEPLGHKAHELLHTHYTDRSTVLGDRKDVTPETCPTSPKYKG